MMIKKILVTGAGGYIGSIASYIFLQKGYDLVTIDNYTRGYEEPLTFLKSKFGKERLHNYKMDLEDDLSQVFKDENIDAIVHYGSYCSVDESMKDPFKYFGTNVNASLNLLQTMSRFKVNKIVFSSTCAVYGNTKVSPVDENHPTTPTNPYGESKLMIEKIIEWYGKIKNMKYVILRYFNVCGASDDGLIGDSKKPSQLLVQNAVRGALNIAPFYITCPEVNTPDKTPIRDYVNVVDLNEAHLLALEYLDKGGRNEIINLGTGTGSSVFEIINTVKKVTGVQFKVDKTTPREGEYDRAVAAIAKVSKILNWKPTRTLEDSIKSLVAWYEQHPSGWGH